MMKAYLVILVALCLSVSAVSAWAVVVPNGSFESPVVPAGANNVNPADWDMYSVGGRYLLAGPLDGWGITGAADGNQLIMLTQAIILDYCPDVWQVGTYTLSGSMARLGTATSGYFGVGAVLPGGSRTGLFATTPVGNDSTLPGSTWVDFSTTFTVEPTWSAALGNQIYVQVQSSNNWMFFDNVRLTLVPEPGTLLALCTGLIGMAGFGLRRRR